MGLAWREAHSAIAHHHCRNAVEGRRIEPVLPDGVTIVMRVNVHESGRYDPVAGIQFFAALPGYGANLCDHAIMNGDIGDARLCATAIDDESVPDDQVASILIQPWHGNSL
jgi:hypothetical protein